MSKTIVMPSVPAPTKNITIRLKSPRQSPVGSPSPLLITNAVAQPPPVIVQRTAPPSDDSLDALMNPARVKPTRLHAEELEPALESPVVREMHGLPPRKPAPQGFALPEEAEDDAYYEDYEEGPFQQPGQNNFAAFQQQAPAPQIINEQEEEMKRAVRKAKLLARITQLTTRGIKPDKVYTWQTSEYELQIAVAKMEVIASKSKRIEQGRSALLFFSAGVEKGCNYVDDQNYSALRGYKFTMQGYSEHLFGEIGNFDDCLDKGMEEIFGPDENRKWYVELAWLLGSSMAMYSMTNKRKRQDEMKALVEEVKKDKVFMDGLKREIIQEMQSKQVQTSAEKPKPPTILMQGPPPPLKAKPQERQDTTDPRGDISPGPAIGIEIDYERP